MQISSDPGASTCWEHLAALSVTQAFHLVPFFFFSLLHQIQADSSRLCRPISCLLLCLSSLNFPSGLSCWQFCCTALPVPAVSFFHVTLHRASWSSKTKAVSLPSKFFLETCFFQTPARYLRRWLFASSSLLYIKNKTPRYWRMKESVFYSRLHLLFAQFPSSSNSAVWAFLSCPALLYCYHPLITSCLKLAWENYRAGLISLASLARAWHSFEWLWDWGWGEERQQQNKPLRSLGKPRQEGQVTIDDAGEGL